MKLPAKTSRYKRKSARHIVLLDRQSCKLKVGGKVLSASLVNESQGGFAVWTTGQSQPGIGGSQWEETVDACHDSPPAPGSGHSGRDPSKRDEQPASPGRVGMRDLDALFASIAQSPFRTRFRLGLKEQSCLAEKTLPVILEHGREFIR
jgi:hypothetical protein